jgi:DNA-binding transcriptional MocR family regulator
MIELADHYGVPIVEDDPTGNALRRRKYPGLRVLTASFITRAVATPERDISEHVL